MGKVAAIQMTSGHIVTDNLAAAGTLLREAKEAGADIACLPENFSFIGLRDADKLQVAEPDGDGAVQSFLSDTARKLKMWILGGTIVIRGDTERRVANSSLLIDSAGKRVARYDKIHLFDVDLPSGEQYRESNTVAGGSEAVTTHLPWGRIGLSICYDLRFPHLYRSLAKAGAFALTVPSAFTETTGKAHWHVLLRARAIENGAFVIAPAQGGLHANGRRTYGHSLIVSPWGDILAQADTEPGFILAEIDPTVASDARARVPSLRHDRAYTGP
jgi:predicted amidohydrolase